MKKVLLDTSVLIDFLRRKDKEKTLLMGIVHSGYTAFISLITHTELFAGRSVWQKEKARKELKELLSGLEVIIVNRKVSRLAGMFCAKYQLDLIDAIIAAEAVISRLPLATLNWKDFKKIKEVKIFELSKK